MKSMTLNVVAGTAAVSCGQEHQSNGLANKFAKLAFLEKLPKSAGWRWEFSANLSFFIYAVGILCVDLIGFETAVSHMSYALLGVLHFGSAWLYLFAWKGRAWSVWLICPELLNILAASLYLYAARFYDTPDGGPNADLMLINKIEVTAAVIDLIGCLGWALTLDVTHRPCENRKFKLLALDLWALIISLIGAGLYVVYYFVILIDSETEMINRLYFSADAFYVCAGLMCLLASSQKRVWQTNVSENAMFSV